MAQDIERLLADIPGLDFEKGLEVFEDDIDDYIAALKSFVKNTPETIEKLRSFKDDNLPEYAINIHGLKSISAWICAQSILEGATELDAFAKAGDISAITEKNEKFLDNAESFLNDLKTALEGEL